MSIYTDLVSRKCEIDHHESDLYTPVNDVSKSILKRYGNTSAEIFTHQTLKTQWYDIPFAFDPWWKKRCGRV